MGVDGISKEEIVSRESMKFYECEYSDHMFPVVPLHPILEIECPGCSCVGTLHMAMEEQIIVKNRKLRKELRPVYYCENCNERYNVVKE